MNTLVTTKSLTKNEIKELFLSPGDNAIKTQISDIRNILKGVKQYANENAANFIDRIQDKILVTVISKEQTQVKNKPVVNGKAATFAFTPLLVRLGSCNRFPGKYTDSFPVTIKMKTLPVVSDPNELIDYNQENQEFNPKIPKYLKQGDQIKVNVSSCVDMDSINVGDIVYLNNLDGNVPAPTLEHPKMHCFYNAKSVTKTGASMSDMLSFYQKNTTTSTNNITKEVRDMLLHCENKDLNSLSRKAFVFLSSGIDTASFDFVSTKTCAYLNSTAFPDGTFIWKKTEKEILKVAKFDMTRIQEEDGKIFKIFFHLQAYESALSCFQIKQNENWKTFAPNIFRNLESLLDLKLNADQTKTNLSRINDNTDAEYNFGIEATIDMFLLDVRDFYKEICIPITPKKAELLIGVSNSTIINKLNQLSCLSENPEQFKSYANVKDSEFCVLINIPITKKQTDLLSKLTPEQGDKVIEKIISGNDIEECNLQVPDDKKPSFLVFATLPGTGVSKEANEIIKKFIFGVGLQAPKIVPRIDDTSITDDDFLLAANTIENKPQLLLANEPHQTNVVDDHKVIQITESIEIKEEVILNATSPPGSFPGEFDNTFENIEKFGIVENEDVEEEGEGEEENEEKLKKEKKAKKIIDNKKERKHKRDESIKKDEKSKKKPHVSN